MKSGTDTWIEAQVGMSVESSDSIKAGDDSHALITFFDGSTIELQADTQIEVVALDLATDTGSTTIFLKQEIGKTISRVKKLADSASQYEVETPAGTAAVRGSIMVLSVAEDGTTTVTNQEGSIWAIADGVKINVPEGKQAVIISGQAPYIVDPGGGGFGGGGGSPPLIQSISLATAAQPTEVHDGDTITYTYTVTNTGNTPLADVSVSDDKTGDAIYQSGDTNDNSMLDVDETWIFTSTYLISNEDTNPLVNTATISFTSIMSQTVTAEASTSVTILRPAIALAKTAQPTEVHDDDTITYTYIVTNTGNTPLADVSVSDDKTGNAIYQSGDTNGDSKLDIDETWIFTATYLVSSEDTSPLVNTATASGTDALSQTVTAEASTSVTILRPAIALAKTAQPTEVYDGDTITYTYNVTNTGNTPLADVSVSDDKTGDAIYQSGDTNGDSMLDIDETWIFTATYLVSSEDTNPLVNTATASGTDALSQTVTAEASASVTILRPVIVRFPDEGTAYIGYEDQEGADFDYNDFGMSMSIEEVYLGGYLSEVTMEFESLAKLAAHSHEIHILRTLSSDTTYNYTITRTTPTEGTETPEVTDVSGQGNLDIVLFDSDYYTAGDTIEIHIEITEGYEPYDPTPPSPRWDLASVFAYYDPYMNDRTISIERHIGDWQTAVSPLPTAGYDVPYVLVVPVTSWSAPPEGTTITDLYQYFDDYYNTGSPENWYE